MADFGRAKCSSENPNPNYNKNQKAALQNILLSSKKFSSDTCETLIIFDLSKNVMTQNIFDVSIKIFLKFIVEYCNSFKYVIIDDNFNGCGGTKGCNITINTCDGSNGCETDINNLDYNILTSNYSNELFEVENEKADMFVKLLNKTMHEICPCKDNSILLMTNRILNLNSDTVCQ